MNGRRPVNRSSATAKRGPRSVEDGSAAAEVVILTPLLVLLVLVLVLGGRLADAAQDLADAARTAVESAALASTAQEAQAQAAATARYEVSQDGLRCTRYSMVTDVSDFTAGGSVAVSIRCRIGLATLGMPGLPGSVSVSGRAAAVIEPYREVR
jgi:Flp pilus assembly protein TadG